MPQRLRELTGGERSRTGRFERRAHVEIEPGGPWNRRRVRRPDAAPRGLPLAVADGRPNVPHVRRAIVFANFLEPADFGRSGCCSSSGLLTLVLTLAVKQGTMKRTFGGDDDDDEDDEDEVALACSHAGADDRHRPGHDHVVSARSASPWRCTLRRSDRDSVCWRRPLGRDLVVWAAIAGASDAVNRLASIAIWLERRPYPYIAVEATRPLLTLAVVVPLLVPGQGIEAAIMGYALGTGRLGDRSRSPSSGASTHAHVLDRRGLEDLPRRARSGSRSCSRSGPSATPTSSSSPGSSRRHDLGTYHLASRAGFLVSFFPAGYRKALRPLQRTTDLPRPSRRVRVRHRPRHPARLLTC